MKPEQNAWKNFIHTGKIDDYLDYCHKRNKPENVAESGGAETGHAADHKRNRPAGLQNKRG